MLLSLLMLASEGTDEADARQVIAAVLFLLGIVIIAVMMTYKVWDRIARRQEERPTGREHIQRMREAAESRQREQGVHAEDLEATRRLAILLDNKAERIERLLEEGEATIARLESLLNAAGPADPARRSVDPSKRERDVDSDPPATNSRAGGEAEPTPLGADHRASQPQRSSVGPSDPPSPLAKAVYELADEGRSPVEIARELDEQIGKVELILALRHP